jgi:hypothetical protein
MLEVRGLTYDEAADVVVELVFDREGAEAQLRAYQTKHQDEDRKARGVVICNTDCMTSRTLGDFEIPAGARDAVCPYCQHRFRVFYPFNPVRAIMFHDPDDEIKDGDAK